MYNIYYTPPSSSITSSVTVVPDNYLYSQFQNTNNQSSPLSFYPESTLQISASTFESSGSTYTSTIGTLRAYIISASIIQTSFPLDQVNIFYNQQYAGNQITIPESVSDTSSALLTPIFYSYISDTGSLPSTPFFFKLYDSASSSIINTSESYENGIVTLRTGSTYVVEMTGSGNFYNLDLALYNNSTNTYDFTTSSSNAPISYSFSISNNTDSRTLLASSSLPAGFSLLFDSPGDIPYGAGELDLWNAQFGITASSVVISGATASLFGGNLSTFTGSLSVAGLAVNNIIPYSLAITSCSFAFSTTATTTTPNINLSSPSLSNLKYFDISYVGTSFSLTSGSLPSPSGSSIETYICSGNSNLISRIDNLNLSSASALLYFEITGNGNIIGGTPNLSAYNILSYIQCFGNGLNGGINSLDGCYNLRTLNYSFNNLTGSIPSLSNLYNLTYFSVNNNNLSGSIPSLSNNTNLEFFRADNNPGISGSIPSLANNIKLVNFEVNDNSLTSYISSSVSSTLLTFNAENNALNQNSIDGILHDLDQAGGVGGGVSLGGGTNSAPSALGYTYTASLVSKGWTVYVN